MCFRLSGRPPVVGCRPERGRERERFEPIGSRAFRQSRRDGAPATGAYRQRSCAVADSLFLCCASVFPCVSCVSCVKHGGALGAHSFVAFAFRSDTAPMATRVCVPSSAPMERTMHRGLECVRGTHSLRAPLRWRLRSTLAPFSCSSVVRRRSVAFAFRSDAAPMATRSCAPFDGTHDVATRASQSLESTTSRRYSGA